MIRTQLRSAWRYAHYRPSLEVSIFFLAAGCSALLGVLVARLVP
jgi:hypothetical protein